MAKEITPIAKVKLEQIRELAAGIASLAQNFEDGEELVSELFMVIGMDADTLKQIIDGVTDKEVDWEEDLD